MNLHTDTREFIIITTLA